MRPIRRRPWPAVVGALLLLLTTLSPALGHSPGGGSASWQKVGGASLKYTAPSYYKWSGFDNPEVQAGVKSAIEVGWSDANTNNSKSMTFDYQSGSAATVFFATTTEITACNAYSGWQGCAWLIDPSQGLWKMWIHKTLTWCENGLVNNCLLAERVAIHEMGHIGGYLNENDGASQADSVMPSSAGAPRWRTTANGGPQTGWDTDTLQRCDEARMQINYDVKNTAGPYADCFDHVTNHGTFGMKTDLSVAATTYQACVGQTVTVSGRLQIYPGHYGRELGNPPNDTYHLDKNPLTSRVLSLTKEGAAAGTATATSASGNNWSKSLSSSIYGSFDFTVKFDRNANTSLLRSGLDSSSTRSFSITWVPVSVC